jgi:hypothetical protein
LIICVFFDRAGGCFLGSGDDKIADAAALDFGGALDDHQRIGGKPRLNAGSTDLFLGHHEPFPRTNVRYSAGHLQGL